jgi:hypothetical protein
MFGDLGLDPGSSITGAPHAFGTTHIDDGVALSAKNSLVTAYNDAAGRPATKLASADLAGQTFTPGVYNASSSLLFSAGNMTLNAQGNPNAVFIFQVGSSLTTGSATHVLLINGAQPCNVFWKIGASATLGTNSVFVGTVMALTTITGQTGMTMNGRLLARNGAVNLDTNTITTSACAAGTGGTTTGGTGGTPGTTPTSGTPVGSKNTAANKRKAAAKAKAKAKAKARARAKRRARAQARLRARRRAARSRPRTPTSSRSYTG